MTYEQLERVGLVVEQLRRAVPGGIGTYLDGLLFGLDSLADPPAPAIELVASRVSGADPISRFGLPVSGPRLASPLATRAWDHGLLAYRGSATLLQAASFVVPPTTLPVVMTVHDLAWQSHPDAFTPRGRRWHEAALRRAASRVVQFITPSQATADALAGAGVGIAPERISVIEEGADHLPAPDSQAADRLLARIGVEGDYLLAVGTLEPRKNLTRLLAAYGRARPLLAQPLPLLVVGPAGWGATPPDEIEGVHLVGQVEAGLLAGLYAGARALAYVPLAEGFGLPVVEAMHAGLPVLSSPVPSAGGATHLVDPLDVESIATGLHAISEDDSLREVLRRSGAKRAGDLTWAAAARAHIATWEQVVAA